MVSRSPQGECGRGALCHWSGPRRQHHAPRCAALNPGRWWNVHAHRSGNGSSRRWRSYRNRHLFVRCKGHRNRTSRCIRPRRAGMDSRRRNLFAHRELWRRFNLRRVHLRGRHRFRSQSQHLHLRRQRQAWILRGWRSCRRPGVWLPATVEMIRVDSSTLRTSLLPPSAM
jgi:hypothetical protein